MKGDALSPLRRQYLDIKGRYPGILLLFQIGDFYETFDEDAEIVARELGVALTRKWFGKDEARPLAGVPVRALSAHLNKLLSRGYKVAICDQVTDAGKGLVEREVVRVVTPGTVMEPGLLCGDEKSNVFLAALVLPVEGDADRAGLAYADVSTAEFRATELPVDEALLELSRIAPAELLCQEDLQIQKRELPLPEVTLSPLPKEEMSLGFAERTLKEHFGSATLAALDLAGTPLALRAAGALVGYLQKGQKDSLISLSLLQSYRLDRSMALDSQTTRNLEIFRGPPGTQNATSLWDVLDQTLTPMGGRLLRRHLRYPLRDKVELQNRLEWVEWFVEHPTLRTQVRQALVRIQDLERLLSRVKRRVAVLAELCALKEGFCALVSLRDLLRRAGCPEALTLSLSNETPLLTELSARLDQALILPLDKGDLRPTPSLLGEDRSFQLIKTGYSRQLDELRETLSKGLRFLADFEDLQRQRTGIRSLKVAYNRVFGYYIEVTRPNLKLVPPDYLRKQTLANVERFYTAQLKEYEVLIASAKEGVTELEEALFRKLNEEIGNYQVRLLPVCANVAQIDVATSLAETAARHRYVRPELSEEGPLIIEGGRHPILEATLSQGLKDNNTHLAGAHGQGPRIMLLTGPNMAGKTVYLRQVALIVLLAQIGSFVPAKVAQIPLRDRIFTRMGLEDPTSGGASTFLSEMIETARVLHQATPKSLVLLDEIGRGTATADGLSIARAVVEYIHNHPRLSAMTLFSTHYHELVSCADYLPRVENFHVQVIEEAGEIKYLHKVAKGHAEQSFGIHVAKLAGIPRPVIHRAQELLCASAAQRGQTPKGPNQRPSKLEDALLKVDINQLSPVEALTKLFELQKLAREGQGR